MFANISNISNICAQKQSSNAYKYVARKLARRISLRMNIDICCAFFTPLTITHFQHQFHLRSKGPHHHAHRISSCRLPNFLNRLLINVATPRSSTTAHATASAHARILGPYPSVQDLWPIKTNFLRQSTTHSWTRTPRQYRVNVARCGMLVRCRLLVGPVLQLALVIVGLHHCTAYFQNWIVAELAKRQAVKTKVALFEPQYHCFGSCFEAITPHGRGHITGYVEHFCSFYVDITGYNP